MWKNKKKNNNFDYEWHYKKNKDFYDKMITNVELRNYFIVQGKSFSECVKSHAVNNVVHLNLSGVKICIYTGISQISQDKFTKQRIIAGAHRANFLDKNSKVVSSLITRIDLTEFEEDFPGISRLLGCGFHFQRLFIATHFSDDKYGLKNSELADVLVYVGCATLDYSAFLFSKKFEHIGDLWNFLTFIDKHPEQDKQQFKQNVSALSRQIQDLDRLLKKHASVIQQMCSKVKGLKDPLIVFIEELEKACASKSDNS